MKEFTQSNRQLILIGFLWIVAGSISHSINYVFVPLTFLVLHRKGRNLDILIAFWALLVFSDNYGWSWAKTIKPYIVIILAYFLSTGDNKIRSSVAIHKPFIPFFIYILILIYNSPVPFLSFQKCVSYILLYTTIPACVIIAYREQKETALKNLIYSGACILLAGLILRVVNPAYAISHGTRFKGIFGNPNDAGMYAFFLYVIYRVVTYFHKHLFDRNDVILIMGSIILTIALSGSRTSMMCVLVLYVFFKANKLSPLLSFILFLLVIASFQIVTDNLIEISRVLGLSTFLRVDTISEGSGRIVAWRFAWEQIQLAFFMGRGMDYNQFIFAKYQLMLNNLGHQGDVHNVFLGFWLDTGLIGLILFFGAFIYVFLEVGKVTQLAFPTFLAMLFMSNYEPWLIASLNPYTMVFLMFAAIALYCRPDDSTITKKENLSYKNF